MGLGRETAGGRGERGGDDQRNTGKCASLTGMLGWVVVRSTDAQLPTDRIGATVENASTVGAMVDERRWRRSPEPRSQRTRASSSTCTPPPLRRRPTVHGRPWGIYTRRARPSAAAHTVATLSTPPPPPRSPLPPPLPSPLQPVDAHTPLAPLLPTAAGNGERPTSPLWGVRGGAGGRRPGHVAPPALLRPPSPHPPLWMPAHPGAHVHAQVRTDTPDGAE